jgi:hypothetical protein
VVELDLHGRIVPGELTLVVNNEGILATWGETPGHWMTPELAREVSELDDADFEAACEALVVAGREAL